MIYVLTSLCLFISGSFLIELLDTSAAYILYDCSTYVQLMLMSMATYKLSRRSSTKIRMISVLYGIINLYALIVYMASTYSGYSGIGSYIIIFSILFFISFIIHNRRYSDFSKYTKCGSFIVYKRASDLQGFVSSIVTYPYGACFLVVNGREFKFKSGRVIERQHLSKEVYSYRRLRGVSLKDARGVLDDKWSILNNCFTVFEKFGENSRARVTTNDTRS